MGDAVEVVQQVGGGQFLRLCRHGRQLGRARWGKGKDGEGRIQISFAIKGERNEKREREKKKKSCAVLCRLAFFFMGKKSPPDFLLFINFAVTLEETGKLLDGQRVLRSQGKDRPVPAVVGVGRLEPGHELLKRGLRVPLLRRSLLVPLDGLWAKGPRTRKKKEKEKE